LGPATVRLEASAEIPQSPFGRYVNIDATLRETGTLRGSIIFRSAG